MREAITLLAPSSNQSRLMRNNQQLKSEEGKQLNRQNGKCHHEKANNKGINEVQLPMQFFKAIRQWGRSSPPHCSRSHEERYWSRESDQRKIKMLNLTYTGDNFQGL